MPWWRAAWGAPCAHEGPMSTLIQRLPRGGQRLDEELADLGLETPADPDHTVIIAVHV